MLLVHVSIRISFGNRDTLTRFPLRLIVTFLRRTIIFDVDLIVSRLLLNTGNPTTLPLRMQFLNLFLNINLLFFEIERKRLYFLDIFSMKLFIPHICWNFFVHKQVFIERYLSYFYGVFVSEMVALSDFAVSVAD